VKILPSKMMINFEQSKNILGISLCPKKSCGFHLQQCLVGQMQNSKPVPPREKQGKQGFLLKE
jgi:hypothetical protein